MSKTSPKPKSTICCIALSLQLLPSTAGCVSEGNHIQVLPCLPGTSLWRVSVAVEIQMRGAESEVSFGFIPPSKGCTCSSKVWPTHALCWFSEYWFWLLSHSWHFLQALYGLSSKCWSRPTLLNKRRKSQPKWVQQHFFFSFLFFWHMDFFMGTSYPTV